MTGEYQSEPQDRPPPEATPADSDDSTRRRSTASSALTKLWTFLRDGNNLAIVSAIGGVVVTLFGGGFTLVSYITSRSVTFEAVELTISDMSNYVGVVSTADEGGVILANYADFLVKITKPHATLNCELVFLTDEVGSNNNPYGFGGSFISARPFSIPSGIQSYRAHLSFVFPTPARIHKIPFRIVCEGAASNVLTLEVKERP